MSQTLSRRRFLKSSGAAVAAASVQAAFAGRGSASANETLTFALIGCGGQGQGVARRMLEAGNGSVAIVALADPDASHRERVANDFKEHTDGKLDLYNHFGRIIDRKDIDFVVVATPDHWHAIPTILACQSGKDVYVEKPCSHNIIEGRAMVNAARKYKRIVQVGQQQRSDAHFRQVVAMLQRDKPLGTILRTATMNFENESPAGIGNPPDLDNAPPCVDYDLWLGPAPKRKFNKNRFHGDFRWFFDYAAGMMGDWNVHLQDIVHWAMGVDAPLSAYATGGKRFLRDNRDTPDMMDVIYEYPGFTHVYTMSKTYQRGGHVHNYGAEFFGTEGSLFIKRSGWELIPETSQQRIEPVDKPGAITHVARKGPEAMKGQGTGLNCDHQKNFLDGVRTRRAEHLRCDIEVGHRIATACHLGNISLRLKRQVQWDRDREIMIRTDGTPDAEANTWLTREYRKGFELPDV